MTYFAAAGIAQKYNCALTRLDYQQEAGAYVLYPFGREPYPDTTGTYHIKHRYFCPVYHTGAVSEPGMPCIMGLNALSQQHDTVRQQAAEKPEWA